MTTIHLHEVMDTAPGLEEPYMTSVLSLEDARDVAEGHSKRPSTSRFRTTDVSGRWPKVVNLAEAGSFETQMESLRRQFSGTGLVADMEDWWQRNTSLRTHGYDRLLIPSSFTPSRAELVEQALKGRVFLHEFVRVPWGETQSYMNALERDFLPVASRYQWKLFGAYTIAMDPREILTVFFMQEWVHMANLLGARESDADVRRWFDYREQTVDSSEEMVLMPGHNNALFVWG